MSAEIREIHPVSTENDEAEQEILDYLMWSMNFENDPHEFYEDPIIAFREEVKRKNSDARAEINCSMSFTGSEAAANDEY